jgi:hypothetical protein
MRRSFILSFAFAAVAGCALLAAPQASARALGSFSIDRTGPVTPTPDDPWGGVKLCTAHLRKPVISQGNVTGWLYHMASGYDSATCFANAAPYVAAGYMPNPNPGFGFCQCHSGFNGMIVSGPTGNGPAGMYNLSPEQVQMFDEGLNQLRQKYQLDQFEEEYELLLQSIEAITAAPAGR